MKQRSIFVVCKKKNQKKTKRKYEPFDKLFFDTSFTALRSTVYHMQSVATLYYCTICLCHNISKAEADLQEVQEEEGLSALL